MAVTYDFTQADGTVAGWTDYGAAGGLPSVADGRLTTPGTSELNHGGVIAHGQTVTGDWEIIFDFDCTGGTVENGGGITVALWAANGAGIGCFIGDYQTTTTHTNQWHVQDINVGGGSWTNRTNSGGHPPKGRMRITHRDSDHYVAISYWNGAAWADEDGAICTNTSEGIYLKIGLRSDLSVNATKVWVDNVTLNTAISAVNDPGPNPPPFVVNSTSEDGSGSLVVTKPTGGAAGDKYHALVTAEESGTPTVTVAGMTAVSAGYSNGDGGQPSFSREFWRDHDGTEGASFAVSGTTAYSPRECLLIRGAATGAPHQVGTPVTRTSGQTGITIPGVTTTVDNCLIVAEFTNYNGQSDFSPAGWTRILSHASGSSQVFVKTQAVAGATGDLTLAANGGATGQMTAWAPAGSVSATAPAQVTGLSVSPAHSGELDLAWAAPADGGSAILSYDVDWALASAPSSWLGPVNISPATAYSKTSLINGTGYVFRVRAVNAIGNGAWSSTSSSVAPTALPVPIGAAKAAAITTSRSPSLTFDTPPRENDIVIMWPSSTGTGITLTIPSGWQNPLGGTTDVESDSHELCCVAHRVTSGEAAANTVTFTATNLFGANTTGNVVGQVVANVDPTTMFAGTNSAFNSGNTITPHVLASVVPTVDGGLVLSAVAKDGTGAYSSQPTGWTFLTTFNTNQGKALLRANSATTNGVTVGPTNITPSAGDEYASITVVLNPVPTAGPQTGTVPVGAVSATGVVPGPTVSGTATGTVPTAVVNAAALVATAALGAVSAAVPAATATATALPASAAPGPTSATVPAATVSAAGQLPAATPGATAGIVPPATGTAAGQPPAAATSGTVARDVPPASVTLETQPPAATLGAASAAVPAAAITAAPMAPGSVVGTVTANVPPAVATVTAVPPVADVVGTVTADVPVAELDAIGVVPTGASGDVPLEGDVPTAIITAAGNAPAGDPAGTATGSTPTATITGAGVAPAAVPGPTSAATPTATLTLTAMTPAPTVGTAAGDVPTATLQALATIPNAATGAASSTVPTAIMTVAAVVPLGQTGDAPQSGQVPPAVLVLTGVTPAVHTSGTATAATPTALLAIVGIPPDPMPAGNVTADIPAAIASVAGVVPDGEAAGLYIAIGAVTATVDQPGVTADILRPGATIQVHFVKGS